MNAVTITRVGQPDEVREFERGRLELYRFGAVEVGRAVYEPGWHWADHVGPSAGTELCHLSHVGLVLAGSGALRMADGREFTLAAGDFFAVPGGHDSWVVGEEQYVSLHFLGAEVCGASTREAVGGLDLENASQLMRLIGLRFDELTATRVRGHFEAGATHHQPWGLVHGGAFATAIETAASAGAYIAVRDEGLRPVGITNTTHFLRSHRYGRLEVDAQAVHQGKTGQLWNVEILRAHDGLPISTGSVRLQNLEFRGVASQRG
jgi:uncharacterized protein (TIGR00369 family)